MVWPFPSTDWQSEEQATGGVTSNPPFVQPIRSDLSEFVDWWTIGTLPSNKMLLKWIILIRKCPSLQVQEQYSSGTNRFLQDLQNALSTTERLLAERNEDELLQRICIHISRAAHLLLAKVFPGERIWLGSIGSQNWFLGSGLKQQQLDLVREEASKELTMALEMFQFFFMSATFKGIFQEFHLIISKLSQSMNEFLLENELSLHASASLLSEEQSKVSTHQQPPDESLTTVEKRDTCKSELMTKQFNEPRSTCESVKQDFQAIQSSEQLRLQTKAPLEKQPKSLESSSTLSTLRPTKSPLPLVGKHDSFTDSPTFCQSEERSGQQLFDKYGPLMSNYNWIEERLSKLYEKFKSDRQLIFSFRKFIALLNRLAQQFIVDVPNSWNSQTIPEQKNKYLTSIMQDFKQFLGRLTNEQQLDDFFRSIDQFIQTIDEDIQIKNYLQSWRDFCKLAIWDEKYSPSSQPYSASLQSLLQTGDDLLFDSSSSLYASYFCKIIKEWSGMLAMVVSEDSLICSLIANWSKVLMTELVGFDPSQWTLSHFLNAMPPSFIGDLRNYILPELIRHFTSITIPELVCQSKNYALVIRNIRLTAQNILPAECEIMLDNRIKIRPLDRLFSRAQEESGEECSGIRIVIRGIRTSFKNIFFRYEPSQSKNSLEGLLHSVLGTNEIQEGFVDVDVDEKKGFTLVMELHDSLLTKRNSFQSTIEARLIHARFHGLRVKFHDTGIDSGLNWRALYTGWYIKRILQRAIEERIKALIEEVDWRITKIRQSMAQEF